MALRRPGRSLLRWRRPRIYLHIGAMKTGTTYLQDLMAANREELERAGYLFPGTRWSDQSRAAADVLGFQTKDPRRKAAFEGRWAAMAQEMLSHRGKASIYSMEFLSFADSEQAARVVKSLEKANLHIILTVRDAASTIPAQWQTSCRNGGRVPFRRFVYGVRHAIDSDESSRGRPVRMFQRTQGIVRMLDVWVPLVDRKKVHVVTVPPRGADPGLLWQRFASVLGVDPSVCTNPVTSSNTSLGHASTELLRRINMELGSVPRADYSAVVKGPLARKTLGARADLEDPLRLHRRGLIFAVRWNRRVRAAVLEHEVDLVGDLQDLPTTRPPKSVRKALHRPSPEEMLDAAASARDGMLAFREQLRARLKTVEGAAVEGADDGEPLPTFDHTVTVNHTAQQHWADEPDPLAAAVTEITGLVRDCLGLSREIDEARRQRPRASSPETATALP